MLSSIKAPRLPRRVAPMGAPRQRPGAEEMDAGEPWAAEAKEFLRSRLIGAPARQEGPVCRTSDLELEKQPYPYALQPTPYKQAALKNCDTGGGCREVGAGFRNRYCDMLQEGTGRL